MRRHRPELPGSPTDPLVRLDGVTKSYREGRSQRVVLSGADLAVSRGELVVVMGRSGSGKSTLLNLVSGIDLANAGRVLVAGRDLGSLSERDRTLFRRHSVGFVFQAYNLIATLTVEENLLLPLELAGRAGPAERRRALALLERVGLAERAGSFPDRLSGGEQQRVAVARALTHEPELVLADEPTGNLDLETGQQVIRLLDELVRSRGATLLMATHAREVMGVADRVLDLRHGRLEEVAVPGAGAPGGAEAEPAGAAPGRTPHPGGAPSGEGDLR
ncbi:MAG: ABC transporter ATP-binding protein [Acidobacteriota bacterium]